MEEETSERSRRKALRNDGAFGWVPAHKLNRGPSSAHVEEVFREWFFGYVEQDVVCLQLARHWTGMECCNSADCEREAVDIDKEKGRGEGRVLQNTESHRCLGQCSVALHLVRVVWGSSGAAIIRSRCRGR